LYNNPQDATALGDKRYNDRLGDLSEDARSRALHQSQEFARRLDAISATSRAPDREAAANKQACSSSRFHLGSNTVLPTLRFANKFQPLPNGLSNQSHPSNSFHAFSSMRIR
jgi:hypothetical protein